MAQHHCNCSRAITLHVRCIQLSDNGCINMTPSVKQMRRQKTTPSAGSNGCRSSPDGAFRCRRHSFNALHILRESSCADKPSHRFDAQHDCRHSCADQDGQIPPPAPHDVAARGAHRLQSVQWALAYLVKCTTRQCNPCSRPYLYSVAFRVKPFCRDAHKQLSLTRTVQLASSAQVASGDDQCQAAAPASTAAIKP
jgi:hypothetical protein